MSQSRVIPNDKDVLCECELSILLPFSLASNKEAYMNDDRKRMETSQRAFQLVEYLPNVFSILDLTSLLSCT